MSICVPRMRSSKRTEFDGKKMIRGNANKRRKISNDRYQDVYVNTPINYKNTHEKLHQNAQVTARWTSPKKRTNSMEVDCESSDLLWRSSLSSKAKAFIGIKDSEKMIEIVYESSIHFKRAMGSRNESRTESKLNPETNRGFLGFKQWVPLQEDDDDNETVSV